MAYTLVFPRLSVKSVVYYFFLCDKLYYEQLDNTAWYDRGLVINTFVNKSIVVNRKLTYTLEHFRGPRLVASAF